VYHILQVEEVVLVCQTIVMVSANVYWLVEVICKRNLLKKRDWSGMMLELPLFISCEFLSM